jgi:hypothetical protein
MTSTRRRKVSELPERLWKVPAYLPYVQPALTDRALEKAQAKLGVKLPRAYVEALRVQNGGYLRLNDHPSNFASVSHLFGIGPRLPSLLGVDWTEVKEWMSEEGAKKPARIDDLIPFCDNGHTYFCLDYRKDGRRHEPRVTYIDVEGSVDRVLALDFGAFLRQLQPEEERKMYGLVTTEAPAALAAALSAVSGLLFEDQGDQNRGYPEFIARLSGSKPGSASLSPNRVRRGFVRKTHANYTKLSKTMPEMVDRHPDHADCGSFLECSDFDSPAGRRLVRALDRLPFASRSLLL